jgi:hypothetical protein
VEKTKGIENKVKRNGKTKVTSEIVGNRPLRVDDTT